MGLFLRGDRGKRRRGKRRGGEGVGEEKGWGEEGEGRKRGGGRPQVYVGLLPAVLRV